MNDSLENILSRYEQKEKKYKIKQDTLELFLDYYASEIEDLKHCTLCNGKGYITLTAEEKDRLTEELHELDKNGAESNNFFYRFARNKIIESLEKRSDCKCKKEINSLRKSDKIMRNLIMKERLNINLSWNIDSTEFNNMTDFRTHYILSLLVEYKTPLNDFHKCTSLWIYDYLLTKEKIFTMKDYNFIYLICTDIAIPNREWLIANLNHNCDKMFTYKVKSKQERRF